MSRENDDWLINLAKMVEEEENQPGVIDKDRVEHVEIARKALEETIEGVAINIQSKVHSPYKSMGCVKVTGRQIIIADYEVFAQVSKLASIVDVCPKTDGRIEIDFTFRGLTKRR